MDAAVASDNHLRVVSVPHCWTGMVNKNLATDNDQHDPVWGGLSMKRLTCRVRKAFTSQALPFTIVEKEVRDNL